MTEWELEAFFYFLLFTIVFLIFTLYKVHLVLFDVALTLPICNKMHAKSPACESMFLIFVDFSKMACEENDLTPMYMILNSDWILTNIFW